MLMYIVKVHVIVKYKRGLSAYIGMLIYQGYSQMLMYISKVQVFIKLKKGVSAYMAIVPV